MPIDSNAAFGQISSLIDFIAQDNMRKEERAMNIREEQRRDLREETQAYKRAGLGATLDMAKEGLLTPESTQGVLSKLLSEGGIHPGDVAMRQQPQLQLGPLASLLAQGSAQPNIKETKGLADIYARTQLGNERKAGVTTETERQNRLKTLQRSDIALEKQRLKDKKNGKPDLTLKDAIAQSARRLSALERGSDMEAIKAERQRYDMLIKRMDKKLGIETPAGVEPSEQKQRGGFVKQMQAQVQQNATTFLQNLAQQHESGKLGDAQYKQGVKELYRELLQSMNPDQAQQIIRQYYGIK